MLAPGRRPGEAVHVHGYEAGPNQTDDLASTSYPSDPTGSPEGPTTDVVEHAYPGEATRHPRMRAKQIQFRGGKAAPLKRG